MSSDSRFFSGWTRFSSGWKCSGGRGISVAAAVAAVGMGGAGGIFLTGCVVIDGAEAAVEARPGGPPGSFGPGYPAGSAAWKASARGAYRTAFMAGMQDQKEGYRYNDDRGANVLDIEDQPFFRQGYRRGYYHESAVRRTARGTNAGSTPGAGEAGNALGGGAADTPRGNPGDTPGPRVDFPELDAIPEG